MLVPNRSTLPTVRRTPRPPELTVESREVLDEIADGHTSAEIGRRLGIAEDTVKSRLRLLYRRLGARDRAHAVSLAYRRRLLTVPDEPDALEHRVDCAALRPRVCTCGAADHEPG